MFACGYTLAWIGFSEHEVLSSAGHADISGKAALFCQRVAAKK
jgi:hypothetical protein